ncbi:MAG: ATP synthase F0 subunit C [Nitrospirae bacterium]|nr:ATP synthase F0 subunit C [Nitrospirota bacterium]
MRKVFTTIILAAFALVALTSFALAAEPGDAVSQVKQQIDFGFVTMGLGFAIGLAALGTGIGMGLGLKGATEGVSRNPGASGKITTTMIIGMALIESLAIYALVVVLIVLFANPFKIF